MAVERADKKWWLRLHIPKPLHEKLMEQKKILGMKSSHDLAVEALERGLDVSSGSRLMVRDLEERGFVELSDYFKDCQELTFVGKDLLFFLDSNKEFLKGKVDDGVNVRFIVDDQINEETVLQEVSRDRVNVYPLLSENTPLVNMVLEGFGRKMVVWFNLGDVRSPFFYFDDSSSQPAVRFTECYYNILTRLS